MSDDSSRQARDDFIARGHKWPPFQRTPQPPRFSLEAARAWWAFHAGFGSFEFKRPDFSSRRMFFIGTNCTLRWCPERPAPKTVCRFHKRRTDGKIAFFFEWKAISFNWRSDYVAKARGLWGQS